MSDYDPRGPEGNTGQWPAVIGGPMPSVPTRSPADLCGRAAGPIAIAAANQNVQATEIASTVEDGSDLGGVLFDQLPAVIREAVDEWAAKLMAQPWRFRREIMGHFAKVFADQFEANIPDMTEEAYEGLREIGFTCLLERLDDGRPVADLHQARIYLDSVHDHHKLAARLFLGRTAPRQLALN